SICGLKSAKGFFQLARPKQRKKRKIETLESIMTQALDDSYVTSFLRKLDRPLMIYSEEVCGGKFRTLLMNTKGYLVGDLRDKILPNTEYSSRDYVTLEYISTNFRDLKKSNFRGILNSAIRDVYRASSKNK
ncbi:MAG: hypothetical protein AABW81_00670, partial [Nanoarchaeota archaeon]